jgi:hypothetical protein
MMRRSGPIVATIAVLAVALGACMPQTGGGGQQGGGTPPRTGDQNGPLGSCTVFPADNPWNTDISSAPVHAQSSTYLAQIASDGGGGSANFLHADFGGNGEYGIPYITVPGTEPRVETHFFNWPEESDPGPYPIPLGAPVEGGSDRHVLAVDRDACKLYELFDATAGATRWDASNGAAFDLRSNALRPDGWTSADAAGLPIFAGLVRYDEVAAGEITHALRVTFRRTSNAYLHPATHEAGANPDNPDRPPMGLRLRLDADFDLTHYHGQALVILQALKTYGLIVADNGSNWFVTGASDTRWDDEDLNQLKTVPGAAFEVVDTGEALRP